jgi:spermidine/putrescine transport system permease protein
MKKEKRGFGKILMILLIIFFYAPILYMIIFSFNEGKSLTSFTGFSLRWYQHMLESRDMMSALYTTFTVAILATVISTVVGTIAAIGLSSSKKVVRDVVEQVNNFPIMNPEIVTAIGFMLLFITFKVERGYITMLLAHIAFCIPYVMLSVMPKVRSLDPNLADAAMDLGATGFQTLRLVIIPEIMPGILSSLMLTFTLSVDDYLISNFNVDSSIQTLPMMIYSMAKLGVNPKMNALTTLIFLVVFILMVLSNLSSFKKTNNNKVKR